MLSLGKFIVCVSWRQFFFRQLTSLYGVYVDVWVSVFFFLNNSSNQYIYSGDVTLLSLACKLLMMFVSPCHLKYLNLFIASTFAQISRCKHKDAWRLALCFAAVARCIDVRWMTTNQMARRILNTVRLREIAMRPSDS